jgi:hypothetical protein
MLAFNNCTAFVSVQFANVRWVPPLSFVGGAPVIQTNNQKVSPSALVQRYCCCCAVVTAGTFSWNASGCAYFAVISGCAAWHARAAIRIQGEDSR